MRLYIEDIPFLQGNIKVYLQGDVVNGQSTYYGRDKDGNLVAYTVDPGTCFTDDVGPFLDMPRTLWNDFLKAMVNHANDKGVLPNEEYVNQGRMEEIQNHMETLEKAFDVLMHNSKKK